MSINSEQQGADGSPEPVSVQIDTSLYTPATSIDWSAMASEIAQLPPGPIIVRVHLRASKQWIEKNRSQLVKAMAPYAGTVTLPYPSIFSERWRDEASRLLKKLGGDMQNQSWFTRISCVYLAQDEYLGTPDNNTGLLGDYSDAAEEAFNAWMWDGNKHIPESATLIPSAEWRTVGSSEYLPDAPMSSLSGLYESFLAQGVSQWLVRMMSTLKEALSSKVALGICTKGSFGDAYEKQRPWGIPMLNDITRDTSVCKGILLEDKQSWTPVDGLIARGITVAGAHTTPNPQVAFLLHEASACWTSRSAQFPAQVMKMRSLLREMKIAVWDGLISDIRNLPSTVKFVVIANAGALSKAEMTELSSFLRKGKLHFLLIGAIGLVDPATGQWEAARMQAVTGIPFSLQLTSESMRCVWADGQPYGDGKAVPRSVAKLASSIKYDDGGNASGQRWLPSGKLYWCACVPLHIPLWRDWLTEAQVSFTDPSSAEV